jgi:hypothetical protein
VSAMARPIPWAAPMTRATLPSSRVSDMAGDHRRRRREDASPPRPG